jgi:hypothetical protein
VSAKFEVELTIRGGQARDTCKDCRHQQFYAAATRAVRQNLIQLAKIEAA